MVYAIQIRIHGGWRTTNVLTDGAKAEAHRYKVSSAYDCDTRVKAFNSEREAWA